jgi:polysaccharide biosynthesis transport protein
MVATTPHMASPAEFLRLARNCPWRWLTPTLLVAGVAVAYAALRSDTWQASQTLIVRNEAAGNLDEPGKFRRAEDLKAAQETILEMAKSQGVLSEALVEVGPPAGAEVTSWPSPLDVERLAEAITLTPPKGAEFGKTEILYLKAKDDDRSRALDLVSAVRRRLTARFQQLRDSKAQSMIDELGNTVSLAEADLTASTAELKRLEQSVGGDLAELRMLYDSASGDGDLRRGALELETELRKAELDEKNNIALFRLLNSSRVDQGRLLATPGRLLESQPSLKRLKEGLVDAQLRSADLAGAMSDSHPMVQAAREAELEISRHLHDELAIALRGVKVELELSSDLVRTLGEQLALARGRLERVAGLRAEYTNLVTDVAHRTRLLEAARKELAEARGSQAGAHSASLIAAIDEPTTGARPIGPGRLMTALAGIVGGLLIGGGVLFLSLPAAPRVQPADVVSAPLRGRPSSLGEFRQPSYGQGGGLSFEKALAKQC